MVTDAASFNPQTRGAAKLTAGHQHSFRLEFANTTENPHLSVAWSLSASQPAEAIPAARLYPAAMPANASPNAPGYSAYSPATAALLLHDGSLLAGHPTGLAAKSLKFTTPWRKDLTSIANADISYFYLRPLTDEQRTQLAHPKIQAILVSGDSIAGDLIDWTDNRIRLSSVVFGLCTIDAANDLAALSSQSAQTRRRAAAAAPYSSASATAPSCMSPSSISTPQPSLRTTPSSVR